MSVTRWLALGAVPVLHPAHRYLVGRQPTSWQLDSWALVNPGPLRSALRCGHQPQAVVASTSTPDHVAEDCVLAQCDLNRHQVCALGPADQSVREFDCWREEKLNGPFLCGLHTDGVGRGLGDNPMALLDDLDKLQMAGVKNTARRFIEQAIEARPRDFADNLTLAVIRVE